MTQGMGVSTSDPSSSASRGGAREDAVDDGGGGERFGAKAKA